ncbi:hypothetical protein [Brevundimonas sp.]|uniref:hypothetical protein n=1 Tax=Brevundimonas sp. TaxID=1871086 RepID=UPI002EDB4ED6
MAYDAKVLEVMIASPSDVTAGLIKAANNKRQVFRVTAEGYETADKIAPSDLEIGANQ